MNNIFVNYVHCILKYIWNVTKQNNIKIFLGKNKTLNPFKTNIYMCNIQLILECIYSIINDNCNYLILNIITI